MRARDMRCGTCLRLIGAVVMIGVFLVSCSKDSTTGAKDDVGCCAPDTPDSLLAALACSYDTEDIELYAGLLHEDYRFTFIQDIADSMGLPPDSPWWGMTKDVASTARMFDEDYATFTIKFEAVGAGWTPCQVERPGTTYTGVFRRLIPYFELWLEEPGCEPLLFAGGETYVDVVAVPHPSADGLLTLLQIDEIPQVSLALRPGGERLTAPASWGQVKGMWHTAGGKRKSVGQ